MFTSVESFFLHSLLFLQVLLARWISSKITHFYIWLLLDFTTTFRKVFSERNLDFFFLFGTLKCKKNIKPFYSQIDCTYKKICQKVLALNPKFVERNKITFWMILLYGIQSGWNNAVTSSLLVPDICDYF